MNTKYVMTASAVIMGLLGIGLIFLPAEILNYLKADGHDKIEEVILQILGSLYFGFAMINWMAKSNLIGGIYARPIAVGNFSHFMIAALALVKAGSIQQPVLLIAATIYSLFAISFILILYTHPIKEKAANLFLQTSY